MRRVAMLLGVAGLIALGLATTPTPAQAQDGWRSTTPGRTQMMAPWRPDHRDRSHWGQSHRRQSHWRQSRWRQHQYKNPWYYHHGRAPYRGSAPRRDYGFNFR
jgi:hypothetical protein